jgi:hypothetical protein
MAVFLPAVLMCLFAFASTEPVRVDDDATLRAALRQAAPGTVIQVAPGNYASGLWLEASGTAEQPIVIEAADPARPPVFRGGSEGIHLAGCSWVTLRNLHFRGQEANGVNADDGGRKDGSARGIVLEGLRISEVNPEGNHDGIKLSGLTDFKVIGCTIEGWGGSGIDMVGCHDGLIEGCTLRNEDDRGSGIQAKGGTANVTIRRCGFIHAGHRALNLGGSTGLAYFRPMDATAEARDLVVEECRFVGSMSPVAFVGSENVVVRNSVFLHPKRWIVRILQETTGERFVPCRNGRFEENVIVFRSADLENHHVNIGPNTQPETFVFAGNTWFCEDDPSQSRPGLPIEEQRGVYGVDPKLELDDTGLPKLPAALERPAP